MQTPDQKILSAIQAGDQDAYKQVFTTCYDNLCQYAFTILKNMEESEDIVQSLFLKLWDKRSELSIAQSVRAYLYRAVYHQCLNQLEHRSIRLKHQEHVTYVGEGQVQSPEVFTNELEETIRLAIEELPDQCRRIFMLSRYEELRYAEIAEKMNLSVNTIENQMSKALRILRSKLK